MIRPPRLGMIAVCLVALVAALAAYAYTPARRQRGEYRVARVDRASLTVVVTATGTVNPVMLVQVGSQVSGQIAQLHVDYNSRVKKDEIVARIDSEIFEARVAQATANVEATEATLVNQRAQLKRAQADLDQARAALAAAKAQVAKATVVVVDARRDLGRKSDLFRQDLIAHADKDAAEVAYDSAVALQEAADAQRDAQASALESAAAQLAVAQAQVVVATAQIANARALLKQANVDLKHTIIRAPIDGVVVSRNVDVGQTVAASLQAPVLFTIAQDLTKMQVETSVDEADIGRVRLEQRATFTVDSFPAETFEGEVTQIRSAAQVLQNVVTYVVVISVDNSQLKLMPGMTSSVRIVAEHKDSILRVPNAALRMTLDGKLADPPTGQAVARTEPRRDIPRPASRGTPAVGQVLMLAQNGTPEARQIRLGATDGHFTEVLDGSLIQGDPVIVEILERKGRATAP